MSLDLLTLAVVSLFVASLVGALLIFSWWQNRDIRSLAWWGASLLVGAVASLLLVARGKIPDAVSIGLANAILLAAHGLFWAGFRVFERRRAPVSLVLSGSLLWLAACGVPEFYRSFPARVILTSLLAAGYAAASAVEIWRGRSERLVSRHPIVVLLVLHAAVVLARYPTMRAWGMVSEATLFTTPWVAFHSFEALIFTVTAAFLLLGMTKERVESEQRAMALQDPLTGLLNRRAFSVESRELLDGERRAGRPAALLLMDLDHFKKVNDRFGHGIGDEVLRAFARCIQDNLPAGALFARLGGEEFACLLAHATEADAAALGEQLRTELARLRLQAEGISFGVTVSIGVATSDDAGHILDALLAAADLTLYRAKHAGRNRVERHLAELVASPANEGARPLVEAA